MCKTRLLMRGKRTSADSQHRLLCCFAEGHLRKHRHLPLRYWHHLVCCCCFIGGNGTSQILAKDSQSKRSNVLKWIRRNFRCNWTIRICEDHGASLSTVSQMCFQPSLPGMQVWAAGREPLLKWRSQCAAAGSLGLLWSKGEIQFFTWHVLQN